MIRALVLILLPTLAYGQYRVTTVAGGAPATVGFGGGITGDSAGNIYLCGSTIVSRLSLDGKVTTVAGTGVPGYSGDGGPATSAQLNGVDSCVMDKSGNLIIADVNNFRIRKIDTGGIINTIVGNGAVGGFVNHIGDGGPGTQAQINYVSALTTDASGNLYFSDGLSIRKLTTAGVVEPFAGGGSSTADGVPALDAQIRPAYLATDAAGNVYVSEGSPVTLASSVRRISTTGVISTAAGSQTTGATVQEGMPATSGSLGSITGIATDAAGNLYIDSGLLIRRVDAATGIITSIAGTNNTTAPNQGPALSSSLQPGQIYLDSRGVLWFGSRSQLQSLSNGVVSLVFAHPFTEAPDGTLATDAIMQPTSIAVSAAGDLYIGEGFCVIRKVGVDRKLSTVPVTGCGPSMPISLASIAVDSHATVYASAAIGGGVYAISQTGAVSVVNGLQGGYLTIDSKDRLYWRPRISSEILTLAPGGGVQTVLDSIYSAQSVALAVDKADNLYAAVTSFGGPSTLARISLIGQITQVPFPLGTGPLYVSSLAIDSQGNFWMVDVSGSLLGIGQNLSYASRASTTYSDGPLQSAGIGGILQVQAAPDGSIYVLDQGCACVRRISLQSGSVAPSISTAGIVNAASLTGGAIVPGELISIFGSNLGPAGVQSFTPANNAAPTSLGGVQVLVNGFAAALTAVSAGQINAFVPSLQPFPATLVVSFGGLSSPPLTIPTAIAAFGLFTADGSGAGQGAILNQDGSYNSAANPAPAGSIVSLFGTGEGGFVPFTEPGSIVTSAPYPLFLLPPSVTIGGARAQVWYAGAAPYLPAGIDQINATIPPGTPSGPASIVISIGGTSTTKNVTVAVK